MEALRILLFIVLFSVAFAAKCTSTTLPNAPVFPGATDFISSSLVPAVTTSNPLTTKHWSETARLSLYRPPSASISPDPARSGCPHEDNTLLNWHDASTWGGRVPANGNDVTIPAGASVLVSHCSGTSTNVFGTINVPAGSSLIFDDATIQFNARAINVSGSLLLGSDTCRLRSKITITLHGSRADYASILPGPHWTKGIAVSGTIDVHGAQYFPTWTRLAMTAKPGDSWIFIQDIVNWQIGQTIVITTTELKDARDFNRNEERTILAVKRVQMDNSISAVQLSSPLSYQHFAGTEYQAEVSLLSRNIVIQGDEAGSPPTDTQNVACKSPNDASTAPCEKSFLTGFGAHVMVHGPNAAGRFSGVEMFRVGQTNVLGHYPIHYHMIGDITSSQYTRAYVRDSSVHESYFRCYAIHGTSGVKLTENTAYNAIGHCYFLEDGVEENNIISYNQAAYVHPLGPYQFSKLNGGDGFWGQNLDWYPETSDLILPSDMSAGCFYITNAYNDIIGNAASGGWAGFAAPSLKLPVKLHRQITNMKPAGRPFRVPFAGNSAHSSGYWFNSAGPFYIGGELRHRADGLLEYTAGRSMSHDTCKDKTAGTPGGEGGCWTVANWLSLDFTDNKVFLGNRGMQNWGDRSNIVRMEMHDVGLSMNVFGTVWIDKLLMECRTSTNRITFFSGCTGAPKEGSTSWGSCNARDYVFFNQFGGFQWYDVGQQHILTDSTFRNCREDWNRCTQGSKPGVCNGVAVFASLTHSDQFVPELMQVTSGIKYENVSDLWKYSTKLTDSTGVTVSGRLQSWYDADGSASLVGSRAMIGSAWANRWWRYNDDCTYYREAYRCPLKPGDSAASVIVKLNNAAESQIGGNLCMNGHYGTSKDTCPVIGGVTHFGNNNETDGLSIAVNGKLSGPLIASSGGWFMRYNTGTPKKLTFTSVQVKMEDIFLVAIPYPAGTTFNVYHQAATWCGTSWAHCRHDYIQVNSIAAVKAHFGDAYYFDTNARTLYLRLVQPADTFGPPSSDNTKRWTPVQPAVRFSKGGQELITPNYQTYIIIEASCSSDPCAPQNDVRVPAAMPITVVTSSSAAATTAAASTAAASTSAASTAAASTAAAASSTTGAKPSTTAAAASSTTGAKPSTTAAAAASSTGPKPSSTAAAASSSTGVKPSSTSSAAAAASSTGTKPSSTSSASSSTTARPSTSAASSSTTRTSSSSSTTRTSSSSSTSSVSTPRPTPRPVKFNVKVELQLKGNYSRVNTSKIAAAFAKTFDLDVSQVSAERGPLVPSTNSTKTRSIYANDDTFTIIITIKDVNETIARDKVFNDVDALVDVLSNSPSFIEALVESGSSITDAKTDVGVVPTEPITTNTVGDFINNGSSLYCSLVSVFSLLLLSLSVLL